ncbi:MAG: DUF2272 domain-containing protein [Acidobacteria bacterium]|nr:DUF2272 domain-containing protein [Acidobacteriota bacterium]MYB32200.1 DUF2272 domain-containing protein [Acidobacteriota bacterium]MYH23491.1 DUF2272 domain-containing protein [Acidobacteriota bacterium]MYK79057.1 DUF2272 domain-containing protein [Acidobacteriota bacterium]
MKGIWSKTIPPALGVAAAMLAAPGSAWPQTTPFERLSAEQFDATPPSALVHGAPGRMSVRSTACRDLPAGETRRRIVDIAAQEWAFFGFYVIDQTGPSTRTRSSRGSRRWWWRPANAAEGVRIAPTIAGYWAATPRGPWMIDRQNGRWNGPGGLTSRWRDPWSAAFISWVMCEGGLGSPDRFQRAIAHHFYVDQAIRARDASSASSDAESLSAAFVAYDIGEAAVEPGDLLCSSRRSSYTSIAQRRRNLGVGARMHCDVVVGLEPDRERILTIGGNVRGTVGLKLMPAALRNGRLAPTRRLFAHLKLRADPIGNDALSASPTLQALEAAPGVRLPAAVADLIPSPARAAGPGS